MARRIDEVDEIGDLLGNLLRSGLVGDGRVVLKKEGNGTGFHRDASFLLFLTRRLRNSIVEVQVIHVSDFPGKTSGDDAVGTDQSIRKATCNSGFPLITSFFRGPHEQECRCS